MTLAFSTKSGQWTTEYSFEPTCYANTDGRMIAFKNTSSGKFWLHDEDVDLRNRFYNQSYKSKMSVVSNEDPSATKAYEAISLETDIVGWGIDVETLDQKGVVDTLVQRENDYYASIPKNNTITSANLIFLGTASSSNLASDLESGSLSLTYMSGNMANGRLAIKDASGDLYSFYAYIAFFPPAVDGDPPIELMGFGPSDAFTGPEVSNLDLELQGALSVSSFNDASKSLSLQVPSIDAALALTGFEESEDGTYEVYVVDEDSGESMIGDYLVINIETVLPITQPESTGSAGLQQSFELYAINVDQHKVNLDHSLGQNN